MWTWDQNSETWIFGTPNHGCGVYEDSLFWYGNVVAYNDIELLGGYATKEETQIACEKRLHELEEANQIGT